MKAYKHLLISNIYGRRESLPTHDWLKYRVEAIEAITLQESREQGFEGLFEIEFKMQESCQAVFKMIFKTYGEALLFIRGNKKLPFPRLLQNLCQEKYEALVKQSEEKLAAHKNSSPLS